MAVTLDMLKAHLVVEHDEDDAKLTQILAAAQGYVDSVAYEIVPGREAKEAQRDHAIFVMSGLLYEGGDFAESEQYPVSTALRIVRTLLAPVRCAIA